MNLYIIIIFAIGAILLVRIIIGKINYLNKISMVISRIMRKPILNIGEKICRKKIESIQSYQDIENVEDIYVLEPKYLIALQLVKDYKEEVYKYIELTVYKLNKKNIDTEIVVKKLKTLVDDNTLEQKLLSILSRDEYVNLLNDKLEEINNRNYEEAMNYEKTHPEGFDPEIDGYDNYDVSERDNYMEYKALTATEPTILEEDNVEIDESIYDPSDNSIEYYDENGKLIR